MKVMQLTDYEQTAADKLSGGNKRKCVALALMDGTNIPNSQKIPFECHIKWGQTQKWSSLINQYYGEAESLCSKIAIQVNGLFQCLGTPQHLKQKFSERRIYRESLDFQENVQNQIVVQNIKQEFPNCEVLEDDQHKIVIQLYKNGFSLYKSFSFFLEIMQNKLKLIKDFQINQATLESVFMHFAGQHNNQNKMQQYRRNLQLHVVEMMKMIDIIKQLFLHQIHLLLNPSFIP